MSLSLLFVRNVMPIVPFKKGEGIHTRMLENTSGISVITAAVGIVQGILNTLLNHVRISR